MAFAGRCGLSISLPSGDAKAVLFNEELGAVLQVADEHKQAVMECFSKAGIAECVSEIGRAQVDQSISVYQNDDLLMQYSRGELQEAWAQTSYHIQRLRDNPECADQEFSEIASNNPGLSSQLTYDPSENIAAPFVASGKRPKIAVLREQGVNGQIEMAAAFDRAGFDAIDVHMSDIISGRFSLSEAQGLVACGGFSYGDVLGAGEGWAKTILYNSQARDEFSAFFERDTTFSLGVCNGCQMLSHLKSLIPGADHWPRFVRNRSEQFEARTSLVKIESSPSVLLANMAGSHLPVPVAHGEGLVAFDQPQDQEQCLVAIRYVDNHLQPTQKYPANPNGSVGGITGVCSSDGRATILMPHPERVFRTISNSYQPEGWGEDGGWLRLFYNARVFLK